jgi:tetratricopeptide (TPR) repeat protein
MKHLKVTSIFQKMYLKIYECVDGDYEKATELYSKAIEFHPDAILYSNRSFAYLRREWYGYALIDAKKALEYDAKYIKVNYILLIIKFLFSFY